VFAVQYSAEDSAVKVFEFEVSSSRDLPTTLCSGTHGIHAPTVAYYQIGSTYKSS